MISYGSITFIELVSFVTMKHLNYSNFREKLDNLAIVLYKCLNNSLRIGRCKHLSKQDDFLIGSNLLHSLYIVICVIHSLCIKTMRKECLSTLI